MKAATPLCLVLMAALLQVFIKSFHISQSVITKHLFGKIIIRHQKGKSGNKPLAYVSQVWLFGPSRDDRGPQRGYAPGGSLEMAKSGFAVGVHKMEILISIGTGTETRSLWRLLYNFNQFITLVIF